MSEMKLTLDQLRLITSGAIQITQEEDGFHFFRFTEAQMALEHPYVPWLMQKHRATAGICLSFRTDSSILHLCADMTVGSGRPYYALDVVVNGTRIGGIDNFSHLELPADYTELPLERHIHTADFPLGTGEKDVRIYLPWGACTVLKELALENGASLIPQMPEKKLLVFGDSITQGYDALYPSRHYVPRLGQALNAQVYNKALGGAISFPELAAAREPFDPDYVLVAYGTNDWRKIPLTDHLRRYRALLTAIRNNYPGAQVFLLTPIWRKDSDVAWEAGPFAEMEGHIRAVAADFPAFHVISGMELVPREERFFGDLRLHPNNDGFDRYFENLWPQIAALIRRIPPTMKRKKDNTMEIKIVAVVGGGMMGRQIALNTAKYGYEVYVTDNNADVCAQASVWSEEYLAGRIAKGRMTTEEVAAIQARFHVTESLETAVKDADLVIEAIFENEEAKKDVFRKVGAAAKPEAIVATNSSNMESSRFADVVTDPSRLANLHYFNPAMVMELVEVVAGEHTSEETVQALMDFCKATGKHPVLMKKELEGFIVNRVLSALVNEAYWLVENGYCTVEDVDIACEKGLNHKMGPFRTKDLTSLDRHFLLMKAQYEKTGEKPVGYDLVGSLYEQGRYGRKSGHGFYDYE